MGELKANPAAGNDIGTGLAPVPATEDQPCLSLDLLASLPAHVSSPGYDPRSVQPGILHFGAGNFFHAHFCSYINQVLARSLPEQRKWGIISASIRKGELLAALRKQDNLFVVVECEGDTRQASVLAPVVQTLFGPDDPQALAQAVADERIRLVTFTVTNKGYYLTGNVLDTAHGDLAHDLAMPEAGTPRTIYWYLRQGLALRRKSNGPPLTMLSLDNIPENSRALKSGLLQFVRKSGDNELADWIEVNCDFPVSTVDRITPGTTDDFRSKAREFLGFETEVVIATEKFRQFIVEESRFPVPPWHAFGVKTVSDCATRFWDLKFFCLNGAHQVPAILGQRLGMRYIHEAARHTKIAGVLRLAHIEFNSVIPVHSGKVHLYARQIRHRFADDALADTVERVSARTTSKVSERLLACVERGIAASGDVLIAPTFVAACWLLNLGGKDEFGQSIVLNDPDAPKLKELQEEIHNWVKALAVKAPGYRGFSIAPLAGALARIGQAVKDERFVRLAAVDAFVRELAWDILQIHCLGLEKAIDKVLDKHLEFAGIGGEGESESTTPYLLFDCDGTLVLSEHLAFQACCLVVNKTLASKGVNFKFTPEALSKRFAGTNFRAMITMLAGEHGFTLEEPELEALVLEEQTQVTELLSAEVEPATGVRNVLDQTSGKMGMALVTSSAMERVAACLKKAGFDRYFPPDRIFSAAALPGAKSKPDPAVYLHALQALALNARECLAVEDSENGVKAAVAAGVSVIGYAGSCQQHEQSEQSEKLLKAGAAKVIVCWDEFLGSLSALGYSL